MRDVAAIVESGKCTPSRVRLAADVIWAMQDRVVYAEGHGLVGYGHYTERYRKQGGVWKIAHLKLTRLHVDLTD